MGCAKASFFGAVVGSILLSTEASAEWWKKNLEQYSYNAGNYRNSGHVINARCQLEKGYTHRINFEAGLDRKLIELGYNEKDMQDVAYRVTDFEQKNDDRDYSNGICRIEVLFYQNFDERLPRAEDGLFSAQSGNDAPVGNKPPLLYSEKR
jgi:hypothetical protein